MNSCEWITNAVQCIFLPFEWLGSKIQEAIYPSEEEHTSQQMQIEQCSHLLDITKEDPLLRESIKRTFAALPASQQASARQFFPKHVDLLPPLLESNSDNNYRCDPA